MTEIMISKCVSGWLKPSKIRPKQKYFFRAILISIETIYTFCFFLYVITKYYWHATRFVLINPYIFSCAEITFSRHKIKWENRCAIWVTIKVLSPNFRLWCVTIRLSDTNILRYNVYWCLGHGQDFAIIKLFMTMNIKQPYIMRHQSLTIFIAMISLYSSLLSCWQ